MTRSLKKSCPTRETKDVLLDTIANDLNADEQTDQDVWDKLAKLINKRWSEKLNSDKLCKKLKKHSRPGNLGSLVAPRVNPEIWANMSHTAKRVDLRSANTQNIISKVGTIIAKCTENLLKAREKDAQKINLDEMVGFHTDALAFLGHTQYKLSLKRREAIKHLAARKNMPHFALKMFLLLRCFLEMTFNSSLTILKREVNLTSVRTRKQIAKGGLQRQF